VCSVDKNEQNSEWKWPLCELSEATPVEADFGPSFFRDQKSTSNATPTDAAEFGGGDSGRKKMLILEVSLCARENSSYKTEC